MFESQYTAQISDRKANAIVRFCRERSEGFFYDELTAVIKMTQYAIADLKSGVIEMKQAIEQVLEVSKLRFRRKKASDELVYVSLLPRFLECLRY